MDHKKPTTKPVEVRSQLVDALRLDLVGPDNGSDLEAEILPQAPFRWYLTGFLVPLEAGEAHLKPTGEFLLDYEDEEDQELATRNSHPAAGASPGATAGPTISATKSSPVSWNSIASAPSRNA